MKAIGEVLAETFLFLFVCVSLLVFIWTIEGAMVS